MIRTTISVIEEKKESFSNRHQMGGDNVMVWLQIGYRGRIDIICIHARMHSKNYVKFINEQLGKICKVASS